MNKLSLYGVFLFFAIGPLFSQTNNAITVFTEGGERFYLILNGIKQNSTAETNVRATGLNGQQFKAKVIFDQKGIPDCDKSIPMMWAAEPVSNTEFTFSVKKDKKGKYKWQFVSQAPVGTTQQVVNTATSVPVPTSGNSSQVQQNSGNMNTNQVNMNTGVNGTSVNSSVTTTTTTTQGGNANGANINIGINESGISLNMNVNDGMNGGMNTTTTTTTTSYTTSTTTNGVTTTNTGSNMQTNSGNVAVNMNVNGAGVGSSVNTNQNVNTTSNVNSSVNQNTNTNSNSCAVPMSVTDYADAKKSISAKPFEDTKKTIAMQVADNNCFSVEQVKGIMALFSFEESKLEFAKYAYSRCTEKRNYYKVNDAFTFDSSAEELSEFIKGK
jgi:hypothetical protein